jgi:AraC-like DNA-binding protein/uncharacterized cupin superfamily protein
VRGNFTEVGGAASDLAGWLRLQGSDDLPPFQRLESISDPSAFAGRLRRNHLDQVTTGLVEITASEHTVRRAGEEIAAVAEPSYLLICQVSGTSVFEQDGGRRAPLRPGDFTIASDAEPYRWSFRDGTSCVFSLRFPQALVDLPQQALREVEARTVSSRDGFGRHLAPFVRAVAHDADLLRGAVGGRLARNLIDLFATGVIDMVGREGSGRSVPLLVRVSDYIAANLADPDLDASVVARSNHISIRYLQALFQEQGTTVTDWIRERRLAGARRDLADLALRDAPIGDIAARWGYQDPAYFSRLFRREFGLSPREWRAGNVAARVPSQQRAPG